MHHTNKEILCLLKINEKKQIKMSLISGMRE